MRKRSKETNEMNHVFSQNPFRDYLINFILFNSMGLMVRKSSDSNLIFELDQLLSMII